MYEKIVSWCQGVGWDKWAHALVFCVLTSGLLRVCDPVLAVWIAAGIGMAKEARDLMRGGVASWGDLAADAIGIAL